MVPALPPDARRQPLPDDAAGRAAAAGCWPWPTGPSSKRSCPASSTRRSSSPTSACGRSRGGWPTSRIFYDGNRVAYEPGESASPIYGGNSNWRGPIWFPVNYLMIEALREYHRYYGSTLTVELPRWSGHQVTLDEAAAEIAGRLARIFLRDSDRPPARPGRRRRYFSPIPTGATYIPFYEYFHGDNGSGLGASHQTGWTALVAELIDWSQAWSVADEGRRRDRLLFVHRIC